MQLKKVREPMLLEKKLKLQKKKLPNLDLNLLPTEIFMLMMLSVLLTELTLPWLVFTVRSALQASS